jgi:AhpD family alkylhydroperoxidase
VKTLGVGPHLRPLPLPPPPEVAPVWAQIERDLGLLAPPLVLHSTVPPLLAAAWATFRETMVVEAGLPRAVKEAMAVAVSRANRCPYCVDAHAVGLHAAGAGAAERAIAAGGRRLEPALRARVEWAAASGRPPASPAAPPFPPDELAQGLGVVIAFQYINRVVTVLLPEHLLPVRNRWLRRPVLALVGARLAATARGPHERGAALALLPPGIGPASGPSWAAADPPVAVSFAALGSAVDQAVEDTLPAPARERATARIAAWNGELPPLGSEWLEEAAAGLPPAEQAAVRLALLTALAPHRAGDEAIAAFRRHYPGDAALVGLLAWSAYRTADRIATWLA